MVIDHHNGVCDCLKASLNHYHDHPPVTVTINVFLLNSVLLLGTCSRTNFVYSSYALFHFYHYCNTTQVQQENEIYDNMYGVMAFIKSDTLSTNKVDIENFSFVSVYLISLGYCLGNSSKKRKKRFIIFLQILEMQKIKSFEEKFNFFETQNTLLCLEEKF